MALYLKHIQYYVIPFAVHSGRTIDAALRNTSFCARRGPPAPRKSKYRSIEISASFFELIEPVPWSLVRPFIKHQQIHCCPQSQCVEVHHSDFQTIIQGVRSDEDLYEDLFRAYIINSKR